MGVFSQGIATTGPCEKYNMRLFTRLKLFIDDEVFPFFINDIRTTNNQRV